MKSSGLLKVVIFMGSIHSADNKRLAKNTIVLYFRTAVVTLVSLYTSRVLLQTLGVEDYGIYNVIGSIVVLFSFLNTALTNSTQRFMNYSLGKGNKEQIRRVFCNSMSTQLLLVLILVTTIELFGPWFLNSKLNIPEGRYDAANWAFHFSVLTFSLNILRVPYNATIIANERMSFFAYMSILEAVLKLAVVYSLMIEGPDKLIFYSILLSLTSLMLLLSYMFFCNRKFDTCGYRLSLDKALFKEMFIFSGWSLFGSFSNVATQNGFAFLINIFYGVVVNAAMGVANQVVHALHSFVSSFQTSFNPQIVKSYAQGDFEHLHSLICRTSKFSFTLMIIPSLLIIVNIDLILDLWLAKVPEYAGAFCQMIIICSIIDATTGPYNVTIMATGKIKYYQLAISCSFLSDLLFSYLLIQTNISPSYILISRIVTRGIVNGVIGLCFLRNLVGFNVLDYCKKTLFPILIYMGIVGSASYACMFVLDRWTLLIGSTITVLSLSAIMFYFVLLDNSERSFLVNSIKKKFK